jgi:hypothetical protein
MKIENLFLIVSFVFLCVIGYLTFPKETRTKERTMIVCLESVCLLLDDLKEIEYCKKTIKNDELYLDECSIYRIEENESLIILD